MVTHPEMRTVMRVMELAFASAQAGEPVPYTE